MLHIHIFLQELDRLYHAGDIDLYEQYWLKACQHAEHFSLLKKSRFWVHHGSSLWIGITSDASVVFFVYP